MVSLLVIGAWSVGRAQGTVPVANFEIAASPALRGMNAQSPPQTAGLRFEVASLKEHKDGPPSPLVGMQISPGRIIERCVSLRSLMSFAYRLGLSTPVNGLPPWANTPCNNKFSVADTYEFQATMPTETSDTEMREMMRTFLADRFKLAIHLETRNMSGYELVVAPGGFKLKPTNRSEDRQLRPLGSLFCPPEDGNVCKRFALGSTPTARLADVLSIHVGRPVVDRTGLTETYLFDLVWASPDRPSSFLPSLPTALQEKFGLELKSFTGPIDTYIVDHAEKPSPD
jgi:uncharacterized protein (TIGR03435 family)